MNEDLDIDELITITLIENGIIPTFNFSNDEEVIDIDPDEDE